MSAAAMSDANAVRRRAASALRRHPGLDAVALAARLGISYQAAAAALKDLASAVPGGSAALPSTPSAPAPAADPAADVKPEAERPPTDFGSAGPADAGKAGDAAPSRARRRRRAAGVPVPAVSGSSFPCLPGQAVPAARSGPSSAPDAGPADAAPGAFSPAEDGVLEAERCRQLWCAVIHAALLDAAGGDVPGERSGGARRAAGDQARAWFTNFGRDFRMVCDLAGLDPAEVRRAALARLAPAAPAVELAA